MTTDSVRVLCVSGSLRKGSFNTALLRVAETIAAEDKLPLAFEHAELRDIPLYDEDVRSAGLPPSVQRFRDQIAACDALLIASPEYNFSVPGVLKNAIDWASRPPNQPVADKPFAIMGASGGMSGTMRMQYHLRQIAVFLNMHAMTGHEVFVRNAKSVFSDDLTKITDEATRQVVAKHLASLVQWTQRLRR